MIVQVPYLILAVMGFILGWRSTRKADVVVLAMLIVYTMGVYLPILSEARYSIHLIPILSILAALTFVHRQKPQT